MLHPIAGVEAQLFLRLQLGRGRAARLAALDEGGRLGIRLGQFARDRMVRRDRDEACAEDRVGTGRIDLDRRREGRDGGEAELEPLAAADPVLLHQLHLVRPLLECRQTLQQLVGEVGDLQEPLVQLALLNERARAPAAPVDHLLVGQHGHVDRVPVNRRFLAIDQPACIQVEEQRLLMPVIIGLAGRDLARPVEREAEPLQLRFHRRDIVARPAARMDALFHRGILGGMPNASQPIGWSTSCPIIRR